MADPTPEPDWYPSALRPKDAQPYSPFDRYHASGVACDLSPDPHQRNEALRALDMLGGTVYACRVADDLIKIGFTRHLNQRRTKLQGELLAVLPGASYDDEQALHARLVDHLHHGQEWYYPTPGVLAVVNEMREVIGLGPVAA